MRFDWDPDKARRNLAKHRVSFAEACEPFLDALVIVIDDESHSVSEDRYIAIGRSTKRRVLFVVRAKRDGDTIWIISARKATRREVSDYEDEIKDRLQNR